VVPHIRTLLAAEPFDRPHRDPWTDRMLLVFRRHAGKPLLSLALVGLFQTYLYIRSTHIIVCSYTHSV
jgi:hypothetical protein